MTFADYILRHDPFVKLAFKPQRVVKRLIPGEEKLLNKTEVISIHKCTW